MELSFPEAPARLYATLQYSSVLYYTTLHNNASVLIFSLRGVFEKAVWWSFPVYALLCILTLSDTVL